MLRVFLGVVHVKSHMANDKKCKMQHYRYKNVQLLQPQ